jgi:hypothetical protein
MRSLLQVLKVNDLREGNKEGRPWKMQDAECILLTDTGAPDQVGVLMLPKELVGSGLKPGQYAGTFALRPNLSTRRIEAVLTNLTALPADYFKGAK